MKKKKKKKSCFKNFEVAEMYLQAANSFCRKKKKKKWTDIWQSYVK